jgi:protein-tyrosine phosphatase
MSHRAQQFTVRDFARFDHVIAMDDDNVAALRTIAPTPADAAKIRLLRSFDPDSPDGAVVPDPYYGGPKGFDEVIDMCEAACRGLLDELRE